MTSALFSPLRLADLDLANRIVVSPMCRYSANDGVASDWHMTHLGMLANSGAGLLVVESTHVERNGRITHGCLGLYSDACEAALERVVAHCRRIGSAKLAIQLSHAGRKASSQRPWEGGKALPETEDPWPTIAPSAIPFGPGWHTPRAMTEDDMTRVRASFIDAAKRAVRIGFEAVELHLAHGYLLHEFLSPISNKRTDSYGGSLENRCRLLGEVVSAVRKVWPAAYPLFVRISATDWMEGGWDLDQSIQLVERIAPLGVDLIDCSSGGIAPGAKIPIRAGYQVPFAREIRNETDVMTGAVGLITSANQADTILREESADVVIMAREFLRQPYWPLQVAHDLGFPMPWPVQYLRAAPDGTPTREPIRPPEGMDALAEHDANLE